MNLLKWLRNRSEAGQSLAEVTVMLPLIIALLAGVIEVSNILIAQNRVTTAAGAATSFAVTNFRDDTLPNGWDTAMAQVAVNSARNTPQEAAEMWDFAVIRAKTALNESDGSIYFESWEMATPNGSDGLPSEEELQQRVLDDVGADGYDLDLIITVAHGQYDSIVGLDSFFKSYPDKLTAVSVGVIDKAEEPAAVCLQWSQTETDGAGWLDVIGAINIDGERVADDDDANGGEIKDVDYATLRTWDGGASTSTVHYLAENKRGVTVPYIKFDNNGDGLGEDGAMETDRFILVVEDQAQAVRIWHKASTGDEYRDIVPEMEVGDYKEFLGFKTQLTNIGTDSDGYPTYTFETTSVSNDYALSHIQFSFKQTEQVDAVCEKWGTPEDTGNYTDIINP